VVKRPGITDGFLGPDHHGPGPAAFLNTEKEGRSVDVAVARIRGKRGFGRQKLGKFLIM